MQSGLSRRRVLQVITAGTLGASVLTASVRGQPAPDTGKQSKEEAQYQDKPKNAQMCATCAYFVPPTSCKRVEGEVHPTGWCKNFQVKS
jgi:hypothetical protein